MKNFIEQYRKAQQFYKTKDKLTIEQFQSINYIEPDKFITLMIAAANRDDIIFDNKLGLTISPYNKEKSK